jgi:UDP-glucuronate decarboxylase
MSIINQDLDFICSNISKELKLIEGKTVLVTGGAGSVGYYLVQSMLFWNDKYQNKSPIKIIVIDNFITGDRYWLDKFTHRDDFDLIEHDITLGMPDDIDQVDYIFHLASIASPPYYRKFPIETIDANFIGTKVLLEFLKKSRFSNTTLLYFSTSEVYGNPPDAHIPTNELYNGNGSCVGPRACYDQSKRLGETICLAYQQQFDLNIKIVRPFNNYGPGLSIYDQRVMADFTNDILNDRDIVILSDGKPTRTFCYLTDAIIGYFYVMFRGRKGDVYNIGSDEPEISMYDLACKFQQIARDEVGYMKNIKFVVSDDPNYLVDNPQRRCPDLAKSKELVGFKLYTTLDIGITKSLLWNKEILRNKDSVCVY